MAKSKIIKIALLLLIAFVILYSVAVYFLQKGVVSESLEKPQKINMLDHGYQVFYGAEIDDKNPKTISIRLDDIGEVAVLFDLNVFSAADFSVLDLSITDLPMNYRPFLVWQTKNDSTIHQLELFQPNGNMQTNFLGKNQDWNGDIVQFGIRIAPQTLLGLSIPYEKDIVFKAVSLRQINFFADYFMLFDYWMQYEPLSYVAVNRLEANQILPIYAQPFVFILAWMLLSFVLVVIVIRQNLLFILVIMSWLFLEFFQINNMAKISNWTSNVYANELKINVDNQLYDIAERVKSFLNLDINNSEQLKKTKVLVLSSDKYQRARIIYHLLPINSSYLDINLEIITQSRVSVGDYIISMSLTGNPKRPINGELVFTRKTIKVKEVWHDDIVSIMEVLL